MQAQPFAGKPTVLRCSRCGRFVNWEDARLQVVDTCRTHVELPPVVVRELVPADRAVMLELFRRDFGHTNIVAFDEVLVIDDEAALVAFMKGELAGALSYRMRPDALQILALATDPMWQRSGVGGHLVAEAELTARRQGRSRVVFCTTNDNLPALYFYQRRGYRLTALVPGNLVHHAGGRPARGFGGIAISDEIRLEKLLA